MKTSSSKASAPDPEADDIRSPGICTLLAGPNGSGKSSIFELLRPDGEFVNADVIARSAKLGDAQAARQTIERLDEMLRQRKSFVYETTLSSRQSIALMRRARDLGYEIGLVFVALVDVELNVRRVAERVSRGGHDIPEHIIRRRYNRSFSNLADAIPLAHGSLIYDNSEPEADLLLRLSGTSIEENHLNESCAHHILIARAVAAALDLDVRQIFEAARHG